MKRGIKDYILDAVYAVTKFPSGFMKPKVVKGYFPETDKGKLQRLFFEELLKENFKRTHWQLVFPGQIAGLIKNISENDRVNEYHVRFYDDGTIDCEREVPRFNSWHWTGPRENGNPYLQELLMTVCDIPENLAQQIQILFGDKDYATKCERES